MHFNVHIIQCLQIFQHDQLPMYSKVLQYLYTGELIYLYTLYKGLLTTSFTYTWNIAFSYNSIILEFKECSLRH